MNNKSNISTIAYALLVTTSLATGAKSQSIEESSIDQIHAAFKNGSLNCEKIVQSYLNRIEAYDRKGPSLHAIVATNPKALAIARQMDADYKAGVTGGKPLHCVPIILKDLFNTADMATTGGNISMKDSRPRSDAFTVAKLREAGALVLAKSNLQEFGFGGVTTSTMAGQMLNPYDLTRNPGGSSAGTAAAIAANFAMAGTGTDTGQSIRSPSSAASLVGIRPTRGLVSRAGVLPGSFTQDEVGPMARTVKDAALVLDAMVGYDPNDPITALGIGKPPESYAAGLRPDALKGARIGVMVNLMGNEERHKEVNRVMETVLANMQSQGAIIIRFSLPEYDKLSKEIGTASYEAYPSFEKYLKELGPDAPVRSLKQLVDLRGTSAYIQRELETILADQRGMESAEYKERMLKRERMRLIVADAMAGQKLDAILYPLQRILVTKANDPEQPERNGTLSNSTGFPAVTFPAGYSQPSETAPVGVPIGAELLALDYSEPKLLSFAYAYEQAWHVRVPPRSTPALSK